METTDNGLSHKNLRERVEDLEDQLRGLMEATARGEVKTAMRIAGLADRTLDLRAVATEAGLTMPEPASTVEMDQMIEALREELDVDVDVVPGGLVHAAISGRVCRARRGSAASA